MRRDDQTDNRIDADLKLDRRGADVESDARNRIWRKSSGECLFFSSRGRHTSSKRDWSSDVCSSDLTVLAGKWDNRFRDSLKVVTREDQVRLLRAGLREGKLSTPQRTFFHKRLKTLADSEVEGDLRRSEERRVGKECTWREAPGCEGE